MPVESGITGAAALLAIAAVASFAHRRPGHQIYVCAGCLAGVGAWSVSVAAHGLATGTAIALVLGMAAASALVLVLSPRPRLSGPVAVGAAVGAVLLLAVLR